MKFFRTSRVARGGTAAAAPIDRRKLVVGAGAAAAAVVAAHSLRPVQATGEAAAATPRGGDNRADGYQETQHVLRYYETAKV